MGEDDDSDVFIWKISKPGRGEGGTAAYSVCSCGSDNVMQCLEKNQEKARSK